MDINQLLNGEEIPELNPQKKPEEQKPETDEIKQAPSEEIVNNTLEIEEPVDPEDSLDEYTKQRLQEERSEIQEHNTEQLGKIKKNFLLFLYSGLVILALSLGFYIVPKFLELQEVKAEIIATEKANKEIEAKKILKDNELKELIIERQDLEEKRGKIFGVILPEIKSEIPEEAKAEYEVIKNRLAIFFEDFSMSYDKGASPLEIPNISFGKAKEKGDFFVIPVLMNIKASEKNFVLFIDQINKRSGSLNPDNFYLSSLSKKKEPVPVMGIDSLNISLPKTEKLSLRKSSSDSKNGTLNFRVSISAYVKSTPEIQEMFGTKKKKRK
jgi:hypothetical protein